MFSWQKSLRQIEGFVCVFGPLCEERDRIWKDIEKTAENKQGSIFCRLVLMSFT